MDVLHGIVGDLDDVLAVDVHGVDVPFAGAGGAEGDLFAVGAEGGGGIFGFVVGQLDD